jgi:hypothetical protein
MKTYKGNIEITKSNVKAWEKKLEGVEFIDGYLYVRADFQAPALTSVGGSLDVRFTIGAKLDPGLENTLWEMGKDKKWIMTDGASDFMMNQQGNITYKINDVQFDKGLFRKIRAGELTAAEVFALPNMEQRRVAYEKMDKIKMKDLPGFSVVHEVADDGCGFPMKIISFKLPDFSKPFLYLSCFCPSGGREYYLETRKKDCWEAKAASFGLPSGVKWVAEY